MRAAIDFDGVESAETLDKANGRNRSHLLDLKFGNAIQPVISIGIDADMQRDPTDGRGAGKRPA